MSESSPQILVNGEEEERRGEPAAEEEGCASAGPEAEASEEGAGGAREAPLRMQAALRQVRKQLRSQASETAPKTSILQLLQKIKDRDGEGGEASGEPGGDDVGGEKDGGAEVLIGGCIGETHGMVKEWRAALEEKLEEREKVLKEQFQAQISQVRREMQAYTDQALRDFESKTQNQRPLTHVNGQEGKVHDRKQKSAAAAAPSLASRRGRVLTRTMTTILPKTCPPVIMGPRAKSETLSSSRVEGSRFPPRDPMYPVHGNKVHQSRKPLLPAHPPLHQCKKSVLAKTKTGTQLGD